MFPPEIRQDWGKEMSSPETSRWMVPPRLAVVNVRWHVLDGDMLDGGPKGRISDQRKAWFCWHSNPTSLVGSTVVDRWYENAGLQAGCDKLPVTNALEAQ